MKPRNAEQTLADGSADEKFASALGGCAEGVKRSIDLPIETQVGCITEIELSLRETMRAGPFDLQTHQRYFRQLPALSEIELGGAEPHRDSADGPVRVAVWNVERLRHIEAIGSLLARHQPDVILLSEVDKGMARSGNRHCLAELAGRLGHSFAYGVEFIELDLGDQNEILTSPGEQNLLGFHGNALISGLRLHRSFMVRIEADGGWFGPARGQQRIGGRMAIGAQIEIGGVWVTFVSVHLESNSSPIQRKAQVSHLLDVVERYDGDAPLLIGGDFNTSTVDRTQDRDVEFRRTEFATDPMRHLDVEAHEPLFRELADRGFDWSASNVPGRPTERPQPGEPMRPLGKIDWIFTRGLRAVAPEIVPALDANGAYISDHDCLLVTVEPAG